MSVLLSKILQGMYLEDTVQKKLELIDVILMKKVTYFQLKKKERKR